MKLFMAIHIYLVTNFVGPTFYFIKCCYNLREARRNFNLQLLLHMLSTK